jgi:DNA sulfur modification protein DndD
MIIKKIIIENFLCYYDKKEFNFSEGLNIILGENGEGKTKFYEALEWLLKGNVRNVSSLISAKKLYELKEDDSFEVSVTLIVEQKDNSKLVRRAFMVEKKNGNVSTYNNSIEGIESNSKGERESVDGGDLLDVIFPVKFRKYSMFKGESELNIFQETETLKNLIETFSFARYFAKYSETIDYLEDAAEKAIEKENRRNKSQERDYNILKGKIESDLRNLRDLEMKLDFSIKQKEGSDKGLNELENNSKNADELKILNSRIKNIENKIRGTEARIDENYTKALLDESWILIHLEPIFNQFTEKVNKISKIKRSLQKEYDIEIGKRLQKRETTAQLLKEFTPLPIDTPSKELMQEMLHEEHCKVCNRPAKKDTESYNFMTQRLEELLKAQLPQENEKDESLYKQNYLTRIKGIRQSQEGNLSKIQRNQSKIQERIEFNNARKNDVKKLEEELKKEEDDKIKILGTSNLSEFELMNQDRNYREWLETSRVETSNIEKYKPKIQQLEERINKNKTKLDEINKESSSTFLIKTQVVIRDISIIFKETEKRKFDEFLKLLEEKTNRIFSKINIEAFTGIIRLKLSLSKEVVVVLEEESGRVFSRPNQSLETSKFLSILFAISELTKENSDESYPMIFDAPTSSFGETKTAHFFNLLNETSGQKILLIKDFLVKDESNNLVIKDEFKQIRKDKAIWVKLERPFDAVKLHTINSQVINLQ